MKNLIFLLLLVPALARAELTDAAENGFTSMHERLVKATPEVAWRAATTAIAAWWNPDHTLSGDASRLTLEARPLGCFCESFGDDAGLVHLTVTAAAPTSLLRMTGGLGPLGVMGVQGNMTWEFEAAGDRTRIRFIYAVGGYAPDGLERLAGPVDAVIGDALDRLADHIDAL